MTPKISIYMKPKSLLLSLLFISQYVLSQRNSFTLPDSLRNKSYKYLDERIEELELDSSKTAFYLYVYLQKAKKEKNWTETVKGYQNLMHAAPEKLRSTYADSIVYAAKMTNDNVIIGSSYLTKGIVYNLFAAVFWGITFALFKIPIEKLGAWRFSFVLETTVLSFSLLIAFTTFKNEKFEKEIIYENLKWYLLLGFIAFIAVSSYNFALNYIDVSVVALLGNLTPVLSIILSIILFRQKINKQQSIGIAILLLAIFILDLML